MTNLDVYDWTVVGYASNQLPGDPEVVAQTASAFRSTADQLSLAARSLRRLNETSDTCSEAVDKIVGKAAQVAGLLDEVYARYASSSGALTAYAPVLANAQSQAEQALRSAAQARHDHDVARENALLAYGHAAATIDPQQRQELLAHAYGQQARADSASSSLASARAVIEAAIANRDFAATKAAGEIDGAISGSSVNDTLMDELGVLVNQAGHVLEWLWDHPMILALVVPWLGQMRLIWEYADQLSLVLTIAALVCLPFFPPAAGVLALCASVVGLVGDAKHLLKDSQTGDRSQLAADAVWTAVDLIPFLGKLGKLNRLGRLSKPIQNLASSMPSEKLGTQAQRFAEQQLGRASLPKFTRATGHAVEALAQDVRKTDRAVGDFMQQVSVVPEQLRHRLMKNLGTEQAHQVLSHAIGHEIKNVVEDLRTRSVETLEGGSDTANDAFCRSTQRLGPIPMVVM